MRIAVLSDIHANLPALEVVIADMAQFKPDHVVVAGDSINWGPFSTQVIERIMREHWAVIRGNHETYLLELYRDTVPDYRRGWTLPRYHRRTIPKKWQYVIGSLPDTLALYYPDLPPIRVVHASLGDHFTGIYPTMGADEIQVMLQGVEETTVIAGHTHLPMDVQAGPHHFINPGSVGLPLNGVDGASYAVLDGNADGWQATFRHMTYDKAPLFAEFERIEYVKHHGATGFLAMNEFRYSRPLIWGYHQWRMQSTPTVPDSLNAAEQFLHSDLRWQYLHGEYRMNLPFDSIDWKT